MAAVFAEDVNDLVHGVSVHSVQRRDFAKLTKMERRDMGCIDRSRQPGNIVLICSGVLSSAKSVTTKRTTALEVSGLSHASGQEVGTRGEPSQVTSTSRKRSCSEASSSLN